MAAHGLTDIRLPWGRLQIICGPPVPEPQDARQKSARNAHARRRNSEKLSLFEHQRLVPDVSASVDDEHTATVCSAHAMGGVSEIRNAKAAA